MRPIGQVIGCLLKDGNNMKTYRVWLDGEPEAAFDWKASSFDDVAEAAGEQLDNESAMELTWYGKHSFNIWIEDPETKEQRKYEIIPETVIQYYAREIK